MNEIAKLASLVHLAGRDRAKRNFSAPLPRQVLAQLISGLLRAWRQVRRKICLDYARAARVCPSSYMLRGWLCAPALLGIQRRQTSRAKKRERYI